MGGGELNNEEFIKILISKGHPVEKIQSHITSPDFIEQNKTSKFIIANFVNLSQPCIKALLDTDYAIYEHDHKYLKTRDPSNYKNFKAPKEDIINLEFYQGAKAILCQSQFHLNIVKKNTDLSNLVNLSGNIWPISSLEIMEEISKKPKQEKSSIMNSPIYHKNTREAIEYCNIKEMEYVLVSNNIYNEFLGALGANERFVFLPKTPETLSRVVVEARMMGMSLITNQMVGATQEPWFKLKGKELINIVYEMRETIPQKVLKALSINENPPNTK